MDFQQRIADATLYRDQTKASYDSTKQIAEQSGVAYNNAFNSAPKFQTIYDKYKSEYQNTDEIKNMQNDWKVAKDNVDALKTMVDKLPQSVGQQFGGTGLTQAQRDMAQQQQLGTLNSQFTQYNADYQVKYTDYSKAVDSAFNQSIDVANKDYDSYWDSVKRKYNDWQQNISDQDKWSEMYNTSQSHLSNVQNEYIAFQAEQKRVQMEREFEIWQNQFADMQRKQAWDTATYMADYNSKQATEAANKELRWQDAVAKFQSDQITADQLFATQ
jgi:hypothetical protein